MSRRVISPGTQRRQEIGSSLTILPPRKEEVAEAKVRVVVLADPNGPAKSFFSHSSLGLTEVFKPETGERVRQVALDRFPGLLGSACESLLKSFNGLEITTGAVMPSPLLAQLFMVRRKASLPGKKAYDAAGNKGGLQKRQPAPLRKDNH